ncbi:MAG: DUF3999 domain-containing protein [Verrucomicrobia bacterium]|nr:DUF3999 domain-containing protein [Verrucomicrobiota bacterium]
MKTWLRQHGSRVAGAVARPGLRWALSVALVAAGLGYGSVGPAGWAAELPAAWRFSQLLAVEEPGLIRLSLPVETLGAARAGLEDLRLFDDAGNELPYALERSQPPVRAFLLPRSFQVTLATNATVITIETGTGQLLDGLRLSTPARQFIKAVQVEGSVAGTVWQTLARGLPIFQQGDGARQLYLALPRGSWGWLRLTVEDQRSEAIPITGTELHPAAVEEPLDPVAIAVAERVEVAGQTRLVARLPAAHLRLATVEVWTAEPLFTREITVLSRRVEDGVTTEKPLAQGTVYRLAVEGHAVSSNATVRLESFVETRDLVVLVHNQDSPPLPNLELRATHRPVYLLFRAAQPGSYHLMVGHAQCAAPEYDLAALGASLKAVPVSPLQPGPLTENPGYRPAPVLPAVAELAAPLDTAAWRFRKPVWIQRPGVQRLDLDVEVLARAQRSLADLRLMRGTNQAPYLLDRTSVLRRVPVRVRAEADPNRPSVSRWRLELAAGRLPIARLTARAGTALFERALTLWEEVPDDRGVKFRRTLGVASWVGTPDRSAEPLSLVLGVPPETDTLILETENGDNPALILSDFELSYPVTRLIFKCEAVTELHLYYGHAEVGSPRYDLGLMASRLLAAEKAVASLGNEQRLKRASWREQFGEPGRAGPVFWSVLVLVFVTLLLVLVRLFPRASQRS